MCMVLNILKKVPPRQFYKSKFYEYYSENLDLQIRMH